MNYLSHAWVLPPDEPGLEFGAALPDLLGGFDRRAPRLAAGAVERLEAVGARELARGVRAHQAADSCFHELAAFREGQAALRPIAARLAVAGGARVRGFFLGHLLLEMLLDASLVEREPSLPRRFHDALARADRAGAVRALVLATGAPRDEAGFLRFVERFNEARVFDDYRDDQGLVRRVGQVLARARQPLDAVSARALEGELPAARRLVRGLVEGLTEEPRRAVARALRPH